MKPISEQFDDFITSKQSNLWIEDEFMMVYVRKGNRYIDDKFVKTIDIANVSVYEEYIGKGYFKRFMLHVETYKNNIIYVESILNPQLESWLLKYDYVPVNSNNMLKFI